MSRDTLPAFARQFFDPAEPVTAIGGGSPGGKARGLLLARDLLATAFDATRFPDVRVDVPAMTILQTDAFDRFMQDNALWPLVRTSPSDATIALAFQAAHIAAEIVGDLRALVQEVRSPLAVRSSSLLEDALRHPFAGVYATKMIPNDQHDPDSRFRRLVAAVKLVYASTFFESARRYVAAAGHPPDAEKMAVVIQEIVGLRHADRFYPDVSGVARSYSFYRSGDARPEEGFVGLALGLGKTIVDGGIVWSYSPAHPRATPPFSSPAELLDRTQTEFWAISMDGKPRYAPIDEVEYLIRGTLADAEADGTLRYAASTYDPASDRLSVGLRGAGPRAVTFAPLLVNDAYPVTALVRELLDVSARALGAPVEIEFALTFASDRVARLGFLQVRPMLVSAQEVKVGARELDDPHVIVASGATLGNGTAGDVADVVFVRPDAFDRSRSADVAGEIAKLNQSLAADRRPYLLIGFGRWGSSDPWLGIPVDWSSISGARAIVETLLPGMHIDPSQGSHFFHNLSSFGVLYFTVRPGVDPDIAWPWLEAQRVVAETPHVRHVRLGAPLRITVDGRSGRGVVVRAGGDAQ